MAENNDPKGKEGSRHFVRTGVDFIEGFAPCAHLLRLGPIFCASKKLLKSWAQGAKVGRRGAKLFMKSTPSLDESD